MGLRNDAVDQICFVGQPAEKEITTRCVTVRLDVYLWQVGLKNTPISQQALQK
jgi:hypothetical protein